MTAVTMIPLSLPELQGMLDQAVQRGIEHAAAKSGELMTRAEVAAHYGVSVRTIDRNTGRFPPSQNGRWVRADVLRWDRERW